MQQSRGCWSCAYSEGQECKPRLHLAGGEDRNLNHYQLIRTGKSWTGPTGSLRCDHQIYFRKVLMLVDNQLSDSGPGLPANLTKSRLPRCKVVVKINDRNLEVCLFFIRKPWLQQQDDDHTVESSHLHLSLQLNLRFTMPRTALIHFLLDFQSSHAFNTSAKCLVLLSPTSKNLRETKWCWIEG